MRATEVTSRGERVGSLARFDRGLYDAAMDEGAAKDQSATDATSSEKKDETNIKETVESILIAFILAFIFRGFVVEAFVIPTGSMAPTLMGAHMRYRCDDCGYEFTVNYSTAGDSDDATPPSRADDAIVDSQGRRLVDRAGNPIHKVFNIVCPNCGYRMQKQPDFEPDNSAVNPPVHFGDRILVLKYLYLLQHPQRWDVVVFKSPDMPTKFDYQQNYIKRLIGRPGESVMLLDGDVYIAPNVPGQDPKLEDFVVQTKPRKVQDALWRIVYDNDYLPRNAASGRANDTELAWKQPWTQQQGTSGWQPLTGREFKFNNPNGAGELLFDSNANSQTYPLTDFLAYDVTFNQGPGEAPDTFYRQAIPPDDNVSDVRLTFFYQRTGSGEGPIRAQLTKLDHTFFAEFSPGKATLYQSINNGPATQIASVALKTDFTRPSRIDFINCDYQVTLRVDDKDVIQTTAQQYHPDIPALMDAFIANRKLPKPQISIVADHQQCTLSHISLWRDIYYMDRRWPASSTPLLHGTPDDFPNNVMRLKADPPEYFCCGDNSPISGDGRYWDTPIKLPREQLEVDSGKVPQRFLLGKAFFVYWPAGFKPIDSAPALLPDFGDMRFIH